MTIALNVLPTVSMRAIAVGIRAVTGDVHACGIQSAIARDREEIVTLPDEEVGTAIRGVILRTIAAAEIRPRTSVVGVVAGTTRAVAVCIAVRTVCATATEPRRGAVGTVLASLPKEAGAIRHHCLH